MTEYVVPQNKVVGWNGFFAKAGDRFASAEAMKDRDGNPIPAGVLERFLATGNMVAVPAPAKPAGEE